MCSVVTVGNYRLLRVLVMEHCGVTAGSYRLLQIW